MFNKKTNVNELFIIPLEQRIYVMEDVDAISDVLYSRDITNEKSVKNIKNPEKFWNLFGKLKKKMTI